MQINWLIKLFFIFISLIFNSSTIYGQKKRDTRGKEIPVISQAQKNALKRIAQLTEIRWQPVLPGIMPSRKGYFSGEPQTGVPYSSARGIGRWIGYDISLETFMTAVRNPESVLYTENLRESPYNVPNGATYYGLTCSSFAQYAFRDDFSWGTKHVHADPEMANMKIIGEQNAAGVEVCDLINSKVKAHMEIITDVKYQDEVVTEIELTEIVHTGPRRKIYTAKEFNDYIKDRSYLIYRYNMPDCIFYSPSKYVSVGNEEPTEVKYNEIIALDRGNKTNYVKNAPVKFNIMSRDAKQLIIKTDNGYQDTIPVSKPGIIEKVHPECGKYSAYCRMKDDSDSENVEYIVSGIHVNVPDTVKTGTNIIIGFSSEMCKPRYVMLEESDTYSSLSGKVFTEKEIRKGSVTLSYDKAGSYNIFVSGFNEFGGTYSERKHVFIEE